MAIPSNQTLRRFQALDYTSDLLQFTDPNGELLTSFSHTGAFNGPVVGNITGNITGNVTGSVTPPVGSYAVEVAAPLTAGAAGVTGQIAYDATHIYVCVATNTWVRATLATF